MSKILLEFKDTTAVLTLNRPDKLNALDVEMLDALVAAFDAIEASHNTRVVLLCSASERAFSVGADIHAWTALEPLDMWRDWITRGHRIFSRLEDLRQPVIAVLNGYTFGGGLELALAADIRLAAQEAEFALPEVKLATIPGWGGTQRLPALIGVARAKQMIFSGERISAELALQWGLVNEVHPLNTLLDRATELANQIAVNAPVAVQLAKQGLNAPSNPVIEKISGALLAASNDAKEGLAAFRERRSPQFTGK